MMPKNLIEDAAAKCDIKKLVKEIDKIKKKLPKFVISDYVRTDIICTLMRNETWAMPKETRENRIIEMLQFLVLQGLNFVNVEKRYKTCLMQVATWSYKICKFLIDQGVDLNAVDENGHTALFYAARARDSHATVKLLLDSGIDYTRNLQDVLLNTNDDSVSKMLIDRCIDAESEAQSTRIIHRVISCQEKGLRKIEKIMDQLKEKVHYTKEQEVMLYEFLGFLNSVKPPYLQQILTYWKKAVELRSVHQITVEGIPFDDVDAFSQLIEENRSNKIFCLALIIIEAKHPFQEVEIERQHCRVTFWRILLDTIYSQVVSKLYIQLVYVGDFLSLCVNERGLLRILPLVQRILSERNYTFMDDDLTEISYEWVLSMVTSLCDCLDKWGLTSPTSIKHFTYTFVFLCNLLFCTATCESEKETAKKLLLKIFEKNLLDDKKNTLLHSVVDGSTKVAVSSRLEMVNVMIEKGVDVNTRSELGISPLQAYIKFVSEINYPIIFDVNLVEVFLTNGAHTDERFHPFGRVYQYLKTIQVVNFDEMKHFSLKCLAARAIVDHEVAYEKDDVPESLHKFIEFHKSVPPTPICFMHNY